MPYDTQSLVFPFVESLIKVDRRIPRRPSEQSDWTVVEAQGYDTALWRSQVMLEGYDGAKNDTDEEAIIDISSTDLQQTESNAATTGLNEPVTARPDTVGSRIISNLHKSINPTLRARDARDAQIANLPLSTSRTLSINQKPLKPSPMALSRSQKSPKVLQRRRAPFVQPTATRSPSDPRFRTNLSRDVGNPQFVVKLLPRFPDVLADDMRNNPHVKIGYCVRGAKMIPAVRYDHGWLEERRRSRAQREEELVKVATPVD